MRLASALTQVASGGVKPSPTDQRSSRSIVAWASFGFLAVATWIFTISRAVPLRNGDRGVFVSMAERLAAGDVLYEDVWDNKEPLFFWTLSLGRLVSPGMDVFIEVAWIAAASVAIFFAARSAGAQNLLAAAAGFLATPLILTGAVYHAGFSHLPATAVFLAIAALALKRQWLFAGGLLPVLALYKIITVPMGLAVLVAALLVLGNKRAWLQTILSALGISAALLLLLAARGELLGFLELVWSNIGYSQQPLADAYQVPIWSHLEPVMVAGAVISVAATALAILVVRTTRASELRVLKLMTAWSLLAAVVITALTGLWEHHAQLFYGPAALAGALVTGALQKSSFSWASGLAAIFLAGIVLSGGLSAREAIDSELSAPTRWADLFRVSQSAEDVRRLDSNLTYMRLGSNTDDSHAYGLRDYDFACYQFVQYYYDLPETLDYIPTCLPTADIVIVDNSLSERPGADTWNEYVRQSEEVLSEFFTCSTTDYGRLCLRQRV